MIEALRSVNVRNLKLLIKLYCEQYVYVSIWRDEIDENNISRGVRQRCDFSQIIFKIYTGEIFKTALDNHKGVRVKFRL